MRNLKRALSLAMASVMLLGMMVVGAGAKGYDDVKETDNVEAIEVLQAIEVMVGDERGFGPDRPVNRAEMAVVMGLLLNLDYNYYSATCPFNDVYDWARGWVGACAANGIVSGRGDGVYDPGATVTAVEGASMLMRALGYFKYPSDYADGFEVSTVRQGTTIGIFKGVGSSATEPMTRNQVAQMVLNALKSGMVQPDGNTLNYFDNNGQLIATGGKINYVYVTSNDSFARAISRLEASSMGSANNAPIVELGEQLYDGKLKLFDSLDAFGRPSRKWELDGKEIGTYVKKELIREEYTTKVTGRTLHDLLGTATLRDYDLDVYIDGVEDPTINASLFNATALVRTNDVGVGATGKGVLTQVFVDPDDGPGRITIAIINTYLAIADEDFDDRTDDVNVTVYGIVEVGSTKEYVKSANLKNNTSVGESDDFKLELEDFPRIAEVKDGDAFLVTVAQGEVQTMADPEVLAGSKITTFQQAGYVVTGGTQYDFASAAEYDCDTLYMYTEQGGGLVNLKDITYDIYLDKYGYAIGVVEVERVNNYLFITGIDTNTNNRYAAQADATAIFLDGTIADIKVDMTDLDAATEAVLTTGDHAVRGYSQVNSWFTYTVDEKDVYEVVVVKDGDSMTSSDRAGQYVTLDKADDSANGVDEIGPKSIALRGASAANRSWYSVYGNDKSIYITAELKAINDAGDVPVGVIGGVESVVTDVDKASVDIWTRSKAQTEAKLTVGDPTLPTTDPGYGNWVTYGAYTLYDKNAYIIGCVVVGEDSGAVTNLVYTHTGAIESETDNNASETRAGVKGTYTWTRKVISGGEEILLTEVGSGLSKLKGMKANTWYEVKYNAKGEVKSVAEAWTTKGLVESDRKNIDRYVTDIELLDQAMNENTTVLYEIGQYNSGYAENVGKDTVAPTMLKINPHVENHTFYVKDDTSAGLHQGFRVADNVKTVFIQTNNNDTTTTYHDGYTRLEKVVNQLHEKDEKNKFPGEANLYHYEVSAVMENHKAVVIVIRDLNGAGANVTNPTGAKTVTFNRADYDPSNTEFYVNDSKVENFTGGLTASFRAPEGSTLTIIRKGDNNKFPAEVRNEYVYANAAGTVVGYVNLAGTSLTISNVDRDFTLTGLLVKTRTATPVKGDDAPSNVSVDTPKAIPASGQVSFTLTDGTKTRAAETVKFVKGNQYDVTYSFDGGKTTATGTFTCNENGKLVVTVSVPSGNADVTVTLGAVVDQGGSVTPPAGSVKVVVTKTGDAVNDVTVTAPATLEQGKSAKVTVTTKNDATYTISIDGKAQTVTANGEYTITAAATATADIKIDVVTKAGSTVTPGETEVAISGTGPYTFTITYTGKTPTEAEQLAAIKAALVEAEMTDVVVDSVAMGKAWNGSTEVGTVVLTGNFNVYVNNVKATKADGTAYTFAQGATTSENIYVGNVSAFVLANKDDATKGYTISGTGANQYINFDPTGLTADVYLVPGYTLGSGAVQNTLDQDNVVYGEDTYDNTRTALHFPVNAVLTLTGTKTTGATRTQLTVGGVNYGEAKALVDGTANTYKLDLSKLTSAMLTSGSIGNVAEDFANVTTIKYGNWSYEYTGVLTGTTITISLNPTITAGKPADGVYVAKAANAPDYVAASGANAAKTITVATSGSTMTLTTTDTSFANAPQEGVIELMPVIKVSFAVTTGVTPKFQVGRTAEVSISDNDSYYFKPGVTVSFSGSEGITTQFLKSNSDAIGQPETLTGTSWNVPTALTGDQASVKVTFLKKVSSIALTAMDLKVDATLTVTGILGSATDVEVVADSATADTTAKTVTFKVQPADGYYFADQVTVTAGDATTGTYPMSNFKTVLNGDGTLSITFTYGEKVTN